MIMSLIAIAIVAGLGYLWATRGFFSALLNLVCVVIAGAVAFGLWEPLAYLILEKSPSGTGLLSFLPAVAWGVALGVPFAVSLAILRVVSDSLLRANAQTDGMTQYIGGGLCGAASGVIVAGILVLSLGMMRLGGGFLGYRSLELDAGNPVKRKAMFFPVDSWVAGLYGQMSETSLHSAEPLTKWYPDMTITPTALRLSDGDGKAKIAYKPGAYTITGRYSVEGGAPDQLVKDAWNETDQRIVDTNNEPYPPNSRIEGFILELGPDSKEKHRQVVIGNTQIYIVVENEAGERRVLFPFAAVAQDDGTEPVYSRFRFDSEVFLASSSAATTIKMAFEFMVPPGFEPIALYLKGARTRLDDGGPSPQDFASTSARDSAIQGGSLMGGAGAPIGSGSTSSSSSSSANQNQDDSGIEVTNRLGRRMVIQRGTEGGLSVEGRYITGGQSKFDPGVFKGRGVIDQKLRIDSFDVSDGMAMVQVDVGPSTRSSLLGAAADAALRIVPPSLIASNGAAYEAIGYVYEDRDIVDIRYEPSVPLRGIAATGYSLSRSRTDQDMRLLFLVDANVDIVRLQLGNKVIVEYEPPVKAEPPRRR